MRTPAEQSAVERRRWARAAGRELTACAERIGGDYGAISAACLALSWWLAERDCQAIALLVDSEIHEADQRALDGLGRAP